MPRAKKADEIARINARLDGLEAFERDQRQLNGHSGIALNRTRQQLAEVNLTLGELIDELTPPPSRWQRFVNWVQCRAYR